MTQCNHTVLLFQDVGPPAVVAYFDCGMLSSDGGGSLLREIEHTFYFIDSLARCFTDYP